MFPVLILSNSRQTNHVFWSIKRGMTCCLIILDVSLKVEWHKERFLMDPEKCNPSQSDPKKCHPVQPYPEECNPSQPDPEKSKNPSKSDDTSKSEIPTTIHKGGKIRKKRRSRKDQLICSQKKNQIIIFTLICASSAIIVMVVFNTIRKSEQENLKVVVENKINPTATETNQTNEACQYLSLIGDNYCDDEANTEECLYDLGDCCSVANDRSQCEDCFCFVPNLNSSEPRCAETWATLKLGDWVCDPSLNNPENFFDLGDCCFENITTCAINGDTVKPQYLSDFVETVSCPQDLCIKSNTYCVEAEVGDGLCQDYNNAEKCDFDLGDCCLPRRHDTNTCCSCYCGGFYTGLSKMLPFWNGS